MDKKILNLVVKKTQELISIPFCYDGLKVAGQNWLDSIGTDNENEEAEKYVAELEADIMSIDSAISFAESEKGVEILGAEAAKNVAEHSKKRKAIGEKYCGCAACSAALEILENKNSILK